ncbi:MAG: glycine cleavage T C-terminal barrel domain-containing protein, partial [Pseudomonadota bacterium]
RPKVKEADFHGKAAYLEQREREQQAAYLCTVVMTDNVDQNGVARYPVGSCPVLDPDSNEVIVDSLGRRSYLTSIAFGPSIGKNIGLVYLPNDYAVEGRELVMEYFDEPFPIRVEAVGCKALYDPANELPKT